MSKQKLQPEADEDHKFHLKCGVDFSAVQWRAVEMMMLYCNDIGAEGWNIMQIDRENDDIYVYACNSAEKII